MTVFDAAALRQEFPALGLEQDGAPLAFFDGPGGTQVPERVIDAVTNYYRTSNANDGGAFLTSQRSDAIVAEARAALADLLNAGSPGEIKFGANMTTLTFHLSRSIGASLAPGDEVIVTTLDHEANVSPWRSMGRSTSTTSARSSPRGPDSWRSVTPRTRSARSTRWPRSSGSPMRPARSPTSMPSTTRLTGRST
jgi:selenocysteine lyase/cysteine desulfurase